MKRKHKISIKVAGRCGQNEEVLQSERIRVSKRLLKFLFGDFCEVLVLTPGETVKGIEIQELRGDCHE